MVGGSTLLKQVRICFASALCVVMPLMLYAYFPLRGSLLPTNNWVLPGLSTAVAQGIVSPFFRNDLGGLVSYFTASTFVTHVAGQWKLGTMLADTAATILESISLPVIIFAGVGLIQMSLRRAKLTAWLAIAFVTIALVALQYAYSALSNTDFVPYFTKFFIPGFLILIYFAAWGVDSFLRFCSSLRFQPISIGVSSILVCVIFGMAAQDMATRHSDEWVEKSVAVEAKWRTVQKYPPEKDAALVGHWGDLTPLWYLQIVEGWRRDLITIFPPTDEQVNLWIASGKPLYLAGPLLEWAPGISTRYKLTPWGELVRVTERDYVPNLLLEKASFWTFAENRPVLRLTGSDFSPNVLQASQSLSVAVYWELLDSISIPTFCAN